MTRAQKILCGLIALELVGIGLLWRSRAARKPLPAIDWSSCMVDESTAMAIQDFESVFSDDSVTSWQELAAMYRTFGLFPQAEYCYRQTHRLSPADRSYLYYWALCLDLMGETKEATRRYLEVIEAKLTSPVGSQTEQYCWLNIGQDRLREEDVPAAIEALRKAADLPKAKLLLSRVLIRAGRGAEALPLLDSLLRDSPDMIDALQMKSWAEAADGRMESAHGFMEKSLRASRQMPKWDPTYQEVLRRRDATGSQAWYKKSLELEAQGQLEQARELCRQSTQSFGAEDRVRQLARLQLMTGQTKEAVATAEDSVKRVGASPVMLDVLGVAFVKLGEPARAQKAWELAAQLEPTVDLYGKLAELQRLAGNTAEMRRYQSLAEYQAGKIAWLKNDLPAAAARLERAVQLFEHHAPAWFYLAETRRLSGDPSGASAAYRRCLQINPDHGRAARALERLQKTVAN